MSNRSRISDIIDRLNALTLEANALICELRVLTSPGEPGDRKKDPSVNNFKKGDQVIITNNYRGQRGTTGVITHVTEKQVTLEDGRGKKFTRKFTNVKEAQHEL
jgi:ATP-dependent exoDNAse (exonuclease V) alpha subunit